MTVRQEFKQTDIGAIPIEWNIKPIIDCADYADYRGKTPPKTQSGVFLVTAKNIRDGIIDYAISQEYVAEKEYEIIMRRGKPQLGDVLITTEAPLGNVALIDREDIALAQRVIKYRAKKELLDPSYFKYYLLSDRFQKLLDDNSSGSTAKGIKGSLLHTLPVVLPPLAEQQAIAEALSDVDGLISALDALIAKKRALKGGAMQELLTGQRRLPGFTGDWAVKTFGEVTVKIGSGITPTGGERVYKAEGRPFIRSQNVGWGMLLMDDIAFIDDETHASFNATEIRMHDVLLNITGASIGRSAVADQRVESGNVNQHVCIIRPVESELAPYFLNAFLLSSQGQKQIDSFQSGGNRQGLNFGQIRTFAISLPTLTEQTAIAQILADMDAELAALAQKRAKTVALKQGMMQALLTGQVRLG